MSCFYIGAFYKKLSHKLHQISIQIKLKADKRSRRRTRPNRIMRTITEEEYNRGFIAGQGRDIGNQETQREPITFTVSDAYGITRFLDVIPFDDLVSSREGLNPAGVETTENEVGGESQEIV
ncbi:hypothetical protein ABEW05_011813 [Botrytis cinerea]